MFYYILLLSFYYILTWWNPLTYYLLTETTANMGLLIVYTYCKSIYICCMDHHYLYDCMHNVTYCNLTFLHYTVSLPAYMSGHWKIPDFNGITKGWLVVQHPEFFSRAKKKEWRTTAMNVWIWEGKYVKQNHT